MSTQLDDRQLTSSLRDVSAVQGDVSGTWTTYSVGPLAAGDPWQGPREAAETLLSGVVAFATDPEAPAGCLLLQGGLACGLPDIPQELAHRRALIERLMQDRFERACAEGDIDPCAGSVADRLCDRLATDDRAAVPAWQQPDSGAQHPDRNDQDQPCCPVGAPPDDDLKPRGNQQHGP